MNRCIDCGHEFSEPYRYIETHGEEFSVCPACMGDYEEVEQCDSCGCLFPEDELCMNICMGCADSYFDVGRGLKFLETKGLEHEFFSQVVWDISTNYIDRGRLVSLLKEEFVKSIKDESLFSDGKRREAQLKAFCVDDDFWAWVGFMKETEDKLGVGDVA